MARNLKKGRRPREWQCRFPRRAKLRSGAGCSDRWGNLPERKPANHKGGAPAKSGASTGEGKPLESQDPGGARARARANHFCLVQRTLKGSQSREVAVKVRAPNLDAVASAPLVPSSRRWERNRGATTRRQWGGEELSRLLGRGNPWREKPKGVSGVK